MDERVGTGIMSEDACGRVCTKCGEFKVWGDFDLKSNGLNKRDSRCKKCKAVDRSLNKKEKIIVTSKPIVKPKVHIDGEVWVDIISASKYQVSNLGRVKHKGRKACVTPCRPSCGNNLVTISYIQDNGIRTGKTLGHLVAEHFVENPNGYKYITYLDKDHTNNVSSNIVYTECRCEHNKPVRIDDTGRTCTRCNNFLSWDNFAFSKKGIRDKHHICRNCSALYILDNKEMLNIAHQRSFNGFIVYLYLDSLYL